MLTDVDKERLIGLIYDAACDNRRWNNVLQELQKKLNADAISWCEFDFKHRKGKILDSIGYDQSYLRSYIEKYASLNVWLQEQWCNSPGRVLLGEEILGEAELVQTEFYTEWLMPQDLLHRVCIVVKRERQMVFYLEALRSNAKAPFGKQEKQCLSTLLPYLQLAVQRNSYLWQLAVIEEAINCCPYGLLAVNKQAEPLLMNRMAEQFIRDKALFLPDQDRLTLTGLKTSVRFHESIANAATSSSVANGYQSSEAMIIPRRNHLGPLWIVVTPLSRKLRRVVCQEEQVALVYIFVAGIFGPLQETMLKTFFGLTPAEQKLARLILEGCRLDTAADKLGITKNTVRTHMKRIYAKTKTENQSDLVRLLLGGPGEHLLSSKPSLSAESAYKPAVINFRQSYQG